MTTLSRSLSMLLLSGALLSPALAAPAASAPRAPRDDTVARCSWDRPGRNAFTGDVVAAIDRYRDIPTPVRMKLKQRMAARQYDDLVDIRRDSIDGKFSYAAAIRDMHFGAGKVCREVTRQRWTDQMHERGLVYCEAGHCILVPTVCRNVSRIDRGPDLVAGELLQLAPPGAGPSGTPAPGDRREGPLAAAATPTAPAAPPITSSFAEAVAGAAVPLFPITDGSSPLGDGGTPGGVDSQPFTDGSFVSPPWFAPGGGDGGPRRFVLVPGGGGGDGGGTPDPGGGGGDGGGGTPDPGGGGGGGGGGEPIDPGGPPPVTAVPEPSTWASLAAGLLLLMLTLRRQRRAETAAAGAPKCATQKRS